MGVLVVLSAGLRGRILWTRSLVLGGRGRCASASFPPALRGQVRDCVSRWDWIDNRVKIQKVKCRVSGNHGMLASPAVGRYFGSFQEHLRSFGGVVGPSSA